MSDTRYQVLGIGNAIVDVIARHDDSFLAAQSLAKGSMQLVDEDGALALYSKIGPAIEISGGSAANTIAGVASLGGTARYVGKVAEDQLGLVFGHDIRAAGVSYETAALARGPQTARCIVIVTPDGQRTMSTFLGASALLDENDIRDDDIAGAGIVYLEGYLWDRPEAKDAFRKASALAGKNGRTTALTLSDSFCVDRHRDSFLDLIRNGVDLLFANEAELLSLYQTTDLSAAIAQVRQDCPISAVTRSEHGSVVVTRDGIHPIAAVPVDTVVDTTGAGDLYAAGFLFGMASKLELAECARLGHIAAAEVISHIGARPVRKLSELI